MKNGNKITCIDGVNTISYLKSVIQTKIQTCKKFIILIWKII